MTKEEYIKKLRVCPFNDAHCPHYDWRYHKCDRLTITEPEKFLLNYCVKCEEDIKWKLQKQVHPQKED